jgi:uncharacterized protein YutE (UPF0331/DUF86 family)
MINDDIKRKIAILQGYLNTLIPYAELPTEELLKNIEKLSTMERYFILMADEAFDVNGALAYQLGNNIPESNESTFLELVDLNILDRGFAEKIAESAKTRNRLVHNYEKVQKSVMIEDMKRFTEMYKEYIKILTLKFVAKEP